LDPGSSDPAEDGVRNREIRGTTPSEAEMRKATCNTTHLTRKSGFDPNETIADG